MKLFRNRFGAALAPLAAALMPASAVATTIVAGATAQETAQFSSTVDITTNYTNSTTTASDVTGLSITVPASFYSSSANFYRVCYWLDAAKATATSGTFTVNVNGSDVTASARQTQSAAGRQPVNSCYVAARPTDSSFIIKLRGVSADTNALTAYAGSQMSVELFYFPQ